MNDAQAFIERCFSTSHGHLQSREPARQQIAEDVELFLANGGKIQTMDIMQNQDLPNLDWSNVPYSGEGMQADHSLEQASRFLGIAPSKLQRMCFGGHGPKFIIKKIHCRTGEKILYRFLMADLSKFRRDNPELCGR